MNKSTASYQSPIGQLIISGSESGISSIQFSDEHSGPSSQYLPLCLQEAVEQLHEYFCHRRDGFNLLLNMNQGTPFQQRVWESISAIPWGETRSYAQIAREIEQPLSVRAVGSANGQNPFLIVLPCHRIIGSSGLLTGYSGGLLRKQWLLRHEQQSVQLEIFQ